MESVEAKIKYATQARVLDVGMRTVKRYVSGVGPNAIFVDHPVGYYALFEGSYEAIYLGPTPPNLAIGDTVKITFEKVTSCQPSPTTNQPN